MQVAPVDGAIQADANGDSLVYMGLEAGTLDPDEMAEYAAICGAALAQTHARSDGRAPDRESRPERRILEAVEPEIFCADIVDFAHDGAKRVYADHKLFRRDHALGVFRFRNNG